MTEDPPPDVPPEPITEPLPEPDIVYPGEPDDNADPEKIDINTDVILRDVPVHLFEPIIPPEGVETEAYRQMASVVYPPADVKEIVVDFLQSVLFKKVASFVALVAAGLVQGLPSHTIAWKIATGVVGVAAALGIVSTGTEPQK